MEFFVAKLGNRKHSAQLLNLFESSFSAQACDVGIVFNLLVVVESSIDRLLKPFKPERSITLERVGAREVVHRGCAAITEAIDRLS